jgi:hypothetical protein
MRRIRHATGEMYIGEHQNEWIGVVRDSMSLGLTVNPRRLQKVRFSSTLSPPTVHQATPP